MPRRRISSAVATLTANGEPVAGRFQVLGGHY